MQRPPTMRLLVIDDDEPLLRGLARMLRRDGCDVTTARGAAEAQRLLAGAPFDVILCDVHLEGIDAARLLATLPPADAARVVLMTGGACRDGDAALLARHRVVYKPFTRAKLFEAIAGTAAA